VEYRLVKHGVKSFTRNKKKNRIAKYKCQEYKTSEGNISEIKIKPVVKKINNYTKEWLQRFLRMSRDRLLHLIIKYQSCEK